MTALPRTLAPWLLALALAACNASPPGASPPTPPAEPAVTEEAATTPPPDAPPETPVVDAQPRPTTSATAGAPSEQAAPRVVYAFPIEPPDVASYGREHHDYPATDIFAPCGTRVIAPTSGVIQEISRVDRWEPDVNSGDTRGGLFFSLVGDDGVRYYGSHLSRVTVMTGERVTAGQRVGDIGKTGSARPTPCHLHFGLSPPRGPGDWEVRRGVVYPWRFLDSWRDGGQRSPRRAVARWAAGNPA